MRISFLYAPEAILRDMTRVSSIRLVRVEITEYSASGVLTSLSAFSHRYSSAIALRFVTG